MAEHKPRRQQGGRAQPKDTPSVTPTEFAVVEEIQHILDTPLAQLMFGPEEKAMAEELPAKQSPPPPWPACERWWSSWGRDVRRRRPAT